MVKITLGKSIECTRAGVHAWIRVGNRRSENRILTTKLRSYDCVLIWTGGHLKSLNNSDKAVYNEMNFARSKF